MGDGFRGRSSTWSAGTTSAYGKGDLVAGLNEDCKLAYPFASLRSGQFQDEALSLQFNDFSDLHSPKLGPHYSPASSTTATELGSQEFHLRSHLLDKTPDSDYGDTRSNLLTVMATTSQSSPSRSMRDWNTSFALSMGRSSGFQDVSSSSTFSPVSSFGTLSQGVVTPCGTGAGSSSSASTLPPFSSSAPYPLSNGSGFPDAATLNKHCPTAASAHVSGSPSPANSQVSLPGPLTNSTTAATTGSGGATNSAKRPARRNPWGAETYSDLIANAIESYPEKQATLQQIYDYISRNYIYFRERSDPPASAGWKNSIRHNLSLHDKFVKCPKASESAKSSHWRLNSSSPTRSYVRRRACSMETGNMKKAKARAGAVAAFAANARRSVAAQARKLPNGGVVSSSLLLSTAGGSTTTTGPMDAKSWLNWEPSASIDRLGCTDLSSGSGLLPLVGSSSSSSGGESAFSAPSGSAGLTKQPPPSRRGPLCQSVAGIGAESSSLSENALAANLLICQHNSATQQSWYNFAASRRASEELSFASHLRQQQGVSNILSSFDYEKARTFTADESGQTSRPFHQQHLEAMHAASANRPHTSLTAQIFRQHFANTDFRAPHPLRYPFSCLHHNYEHQSQGPQAQPVAQQPTPPPAQQQQSNYVTEPRRSLNLIDLQPANPGIAYRESARCSASPERSGHSVSGMVRTTSPPPPPPPPLHPAPPPSYSSDLTDVSLEPVSYCLSNIMSDAAGDNIDIPERFLRSNSTDEEMTPIVSASSVVTAVESPPQASAPPLLTNHSSHLHNLLTSSGNGPHSSATSVGPARSSETVLPLSQGQNTNNYIESLELQLSLQVANRVVGSCLSTAAPEELTTGDTDVCSPKMHWPRTVENGAN